MSKPDWHKSSYSGGNGGDCVEVREGARTDVRDTQNRGQGHLSVPAREWDALLNAVRS